MPRLEQELKVCKSVFRVIEKRQNETLEIIDRPDQTGSNEKAVDFFVRGKLTNYVVEHTLIESVSGQLADDAKFVKLLKNLEENLDGALPQPGSYSLNIEFGAIQKIKNAKQVQGSLELWIRTKASLLELDSPITAPRYYISETPFGVPFNCALYRSPTSDGKFFIGRFLPNDLEEKRCVRIKQALVDKCPKLEVAKKENKGARSVLIFESNDSALSSHSAIGEAFIRAISERTDDRPDEVYLVESGLVWVLKDGEISFPCVNLPGPH